MSIVEVRELVKQYPSFALSGVSFDVREGRITGFIGRDVTARNNACELYFEEENVDSFYEKLKTFYPETEFVNLPSTRS